MNTKALYPIKREFSSTRLETLKKVLEDRAEEELWMVHRHPMFPLIWNGIIAALMIALCISFVIWGVNIKIQNTADALTAEAMAERDAREQAAAEAENQRLAAEAASESSIIKAEAQDCAKALYGIRNFIEKYSYSYLDCETYLRAAFNRADATGNSLHDVLFQEGQFLACSENNPVLTELLDVSIDTVTEWHNEESRPCDVSYQFAELTPNGIYLKNDFNADGYAIRWRAK